MAQLSFVIISSRLEIGEALEQTGHALVKASVSEAGSLAEAVQRHRPDALFLDLIEDADARLDELEALPGPRPPMLVTGPEDESQLILRASRAVGACHLVFLQDDGSEFQLLLSFVNNTNIAYAALRSSRE